VDKKRRSEFQPHAAPANPAPPGAAPSVALRWRPPPSANDNRPAALRRIVSGAIRLLAAAFVAFAAAYLAGLI